MIFDKRLTATAAVLGALAIAAPVAGASADATSPASTAPSADVCASLAQGGAAAVSALRAARCIRSHGRPQRAAQSRRELRWGDQLRASGQTVGSFVNANLSLAQHAAG